jgi:hypothetical protein
LFYIILFSFLVHPFDACYRLAITGANNQKEKIMKKLRITLASVAFAAASMTTAAFAGDKDVVQTF